MTKRFAVGTIHETPKGMIQITSLENGIVKYFYLDRPNEIISNKLVNLRSNIDKYKERQIIKAIKENGAKEVIESLKNENIKLKAEIKKLKTQLAELQSQSQQPAQADEAMYEVKDFDGNTVGVFPSVAQATRAIDQEAETIGCNPSDLRKAFRIEKTH